MNMLSSLQTIADLTEFSSMQKEIVCVLSMQIQKSEYPYVHFSVLLLSFLYLLYSFLQNISIQWLNFCVESLLDVQTPVCVAATD